MVGHSGTGPEAERLVEWSKPPRTVICLARGNDMSDSSGSCKREMIRKSEIP